MVLLLLMKISLKSTLRWWSAEVLNWLPEALQIYPPSLHSGTVFAIDASIPIPGDLTLLGLCFPWATVTNPGLQLSLLHTAPPLP